MTSPEPRYRVLITDYVWPSTNPEREVLASIGAEVIEAPDPSEDTLATLAVNADAIMTCFAQVTPRVVQSATRCGCICRYGVGVDNIAVDTATELGIVVTNVPDYCVDEVSDHVMALLLTWNRQIGFYDRMAREGRWEGTTPPVPLTRLRGQTLGIVGLGRIGRAVAEKAQAFGLAILAHDPYLPAEADPPTGVRLVDLPELLRESDYVTVHTPLNQETEALVGAPELAMMKPNAFLINCARGPIMNETALYTALKERRIAGAGLDVLEQADPPADHPLFQLDNLLVTPHVAFLSRQSVHELQVRTAQAVVDVLSGRRPPFVINPETLPLARARLV